MTSPLKSSLKNRLEEESLTDSEIKALQDLAKRTTKHKWSLISLPDWLYPALGGLVAGLMVMMFSFPTINNSAHDTHQRIAHEVLTNHLHVKPLDVSTNSIAQVQATMDRLNFNPKLSKHLPSTQATLIGGRYCTLQGVIAAQLKLLMPTGEVITYYEAAYDKSRFGKLPKAENKEQPILVKENGFTMRMWQESDLVMVTAQQTK